MKEQNIGSHNEQKGLPDQRNQDTKVVKEDFPVETGNPAKPAITDDEGNLHSKSSNQAKGYSEPKPTEAWSEVLPPDDPGTAVLPPENQPANTEKVYGEDVGKPAEKPGD